MKRHRHTPEQIVRTLRKGDRLAERGQGPCRGAPHARGVGVELEPLGEHQYGGMATKAKRLRELESENSRLKKLLAEAELDKSILKELAEGNF